MPGGGGASLLVRATDEKRTDVDVAALLSKEGLQCV